MCIRDSYHATATAGRVVTADRGVDERQTRARSGSANCTAVSCRSIAGQCRIDDRQRTVVDNSATVRRAAAGHGQADDARRLAGVDIEYTAGVVTANRDALTTIVVDGYVLRYRKLSTVQRNRMRSCTREIERNRIAATHVRQRFSQRARTVVAGGARYDWVRCARVNILRDQVALRRIEVSIAGIIRADVV